MAQSDALRNTASQVEERAKAIWKAMVEEAQAKHIPRTETEYGLGFYMDGTVAEYARACWPGTNWRKGSGKTAMNMVRQFLRSTGNVVAQPGSGRKTFVRAYWAYRDSIPVIVGVPNDRRQAIEDRQREQRRQEARITPEEAGETRSPAPVTERRDPVVAAAKAHPEYGEATPHPKYPSFVQFSNGKSQCTRCQKVVQTRGLGPHQKMHDDADLGVEVERLRGALAEAEAKATANMRDIDPAQAINVLGDYVNALQEERDSLNARLHIAEGKPQSDGVAEAKIELVREVLTRVQNGEVTMLRAISDINDALEA